MERKLGIAGLEVIQAHTEHTEEEEKVIRPISAIFDTRVLGYE